MHHLLRRLLPSAALLAVVLAAAAAPAAGAAFTVASGDLAAAAATARIGDRLQVTDVELPATGETLTLDVERFTVFAPDAEIVVHRADGVEKLPAPRNAYFRGTVAGEAGSRVFLEVLESGQTRGVITRAGDDASLIDSAETDGSEAVSYTHLTLPTILRV